MRKSVALLVLLSIYNGYPLKAMDQEHSNMNLFPNVVTIGEAMEEVTFWLLIIPTLAA